MFKSMDADNSGTITVDELRRGLAKQGTKLSEAEVEQLMAAVSFHFHFHTYTWHTCALLMLTHGHCAEAERYA